jgi:hypothetical protein
LLEGIHGLNPRLAELVPSGAAFAVFVCPLTQLPFDRLSRVHTSDVRLLRRIVRDRHGRGHDAASSIARWPSVRAGERRHIFPYQHRADAVFDTSLIYELSVLKVYAQRYLLEVPTSHPSYTMAYRLQQLLERFVPIYPDHVPPTSIVREFIGASGFEVLTAAGQRNRRLRAARWIGSRVRLSLASCLRSASLTRATSSTATGTGRVGLRTSAIAISGRCPYSRRPAIWVSSSVDTVVMRAIAATSSSCQPRVAQHVDVDRAVGIAQHRLPRVAIAVERALDLVEHLGGVVGPGPRGRRGRRRDLAAGQRLELRARRRVDADRHADAREHLQHLRRHAHRRVPRGHLQLDRREQLDAGRHLAAHQEPALGQLRRSVGRERGAVRVAGDQAHHLHRSADPRIRAPPTQA